MAKSSDYSKPANRGGNGNWWCPITEYGRNPFHGTLGRKVPVKPEPKEDANEKD